LEESKKQNSQAILRGDGRGEEGGGSRVRRRGRRGRRREGGN